VGCRLCRKEKETGEHYSDGSSSIAPDREICFFRGVIGKGGGGIPGNLGAFGAK